MDAPLSVIEGIEKALSSKVPAPPVWPLADPFIGTVQLVYPNFKKQIYAKAEFTIKELLDAELLRRLAPDSRSGFCPPYKLTLVQHQEVFFDKRVHSPARNFWTKVDWGWSLDFDCRCYSKSGYIKVTQKLSDKDRVARPSKRPALARLSESKLKEKQVLISRLETIKELQNLLFTQWQEILKANTQSYDAFFDYCGLANLHYLNDQRKKIENQMADVFQAWKQ